MAKHLADNPSKKDSPMHYRCLTLLLICSFLFAGCSRSNEVELAREKAEAEAAKAKAEAELARVELEKLKAAQSESQPVQTPKKQPSAPAKQPNEPASPPAEESSAAASPPPPGKLILERQMIRPGVLRSFHVVHGQYGAQPKLEPGTGVTLTGGHTAPALWTKEYLGKKYRAEFEMKLGNEHAWVVCVLNGPGYGNSFEGGYGCRINQRHIALLRDGKEVETVDRPQGAGEWSRIQANVDGGNIEITLDGVPFAAMEDAEPLDGPANGWLGLVGREVTLRNLKIWSPESDTKRERQLTPPVTEQPAPNGELLYELKLAGAELGSEWHKTQPEFSKSKDGALILQGPNGTPNVVLDKPLTGDVACEVEFEFHDKEAVNFSLALWSSEKVPTSLDEINQCGGWRVGLPEGNGKSAVFWHGQADGGQGVWRQGSLLTSTAYYAPISGRKYLVRVETHGENLRVFLDGGLLLEAKRPAPAPSTPTFFGMRQIYGGSKVFAVRIFKLAE
jgi:hypothetical protein